MKQSKNDNEIVICELADYAPPFYGNFMNSLFNLEKKIININNKIIYIFYKNTSHCTWAKQMIHDNKNIYFISDKKIKGFLELRKILINNSVDILHLHFNIPYIILILMKLFCSKITIITHFHNTLSGISCIPRSHSFLFSIKNKIRVVLYNNLFDKACGCGETVFDDLVKSGVRKHKCCYVDNGIDFSRLDVDCENGKEVYNVRDKRVLMIYGTHFYRKGVDIAINAIKDIVAEYNIVLMIVCQNKDFVIEQIKAILSDIPEWILIVQSQENIAFYYKMSDILLMPSREEGLPYLMMEAVYCGTPVIKSNIPQMSIKMPNDIFVSVNNALDLQQSIISVLNQTDDNKKTILKEQKEYVVSGWNIDIWSNKILNMYLQYVKRKEKVPKNDTKNNTLLLAI